jgi:hypothetical protein
MGASNLIGTDGPETCPSFLAEDSKDVYAARFTKLLQRRRKRRVIIERNRCAKTLATSVQGAQ